MEPLTMAHSNAARATGLLAVIAIAVACSGPSSAGQVSVSLPNGGFEQQSNGRPSGWFIDSKILGKGRIEVDSSRKQSGTFALKLSPNGNNVTSNEPLAVGQMLPAVPVRGRRVRISAWLHVEGGASAVVGFAAIPNGGGAPLAMQQLIQGDGTDTPAVKSAVLDVPANADQLIVFCAVNGTTGNAFFDDVTVTPLTDAESPASPDSKTGGAPRARSDVTTALRAEVVVEGQREIRSVPETLFGTNVEWIWNGNGIWDQGRNRPDADVVRLARELGVNLIRFPGGVFSDYYHWRDAIGPQSSRPETLHYPDGPRSRHTFGTEEALQLAQLVGARLFVTVNAGTGTPEEAAEWVRYLNKSPRASDQRRVDLWEVGNELYMKGDFTRSSMPPDKYAERFLATARAMKKVDPTIRIGGIGGQNYGRYQFVSYSDWNRVLLERAGAELDFLAVHNAYAPVLVGENQPDGQAVYAAMLAAPLLVRNNLTTLNKQIDTFAPRDKDRIKIAVTEWGPLFHIDPKHPMIDHVKTLGSALFVASVLKVFLESPRMDIAHFFKLTESTFMGWIGLRQGRKVVTAPYLAFQLYTRHFGRVVLESTTRVDTYDSPGIGALDAVDGVPYLDVIASRSRDGESLYVLAINKHFFRPIAARIRINGFVPQTSGQAWTLSGKGLDAHTGTELRSDTPGLQWARQLEVAPWNRFHQGGTQEVALVSTPLQGLSGNIEHSFPPLSVTSVEFRRAR